MTRRLAIIACGALAREIRAVLGPSRLAHIRLHCLPALLHNRPERIVAAVESAINEARARDEWPFVAYADCGTGGGLDRLLARENVARLPGPHCYAFYTGVEAFERAAESDMRSFFLTDFLARQFEALVIEPLGLDRHPELRDAYFGQYERLVFLEQSSDLALRQKAREAAARLGLAFEHRVTGYGDLSLSLSRVSKHQSG